MTSPPVRDPRTRWRIGLELVTARPRDARGATGRATADLAGALAEHGPAVAVLVDDEPATRLLALADHDRADGLGLLALASDALGLTLRTDARGVAGRPLAAGGRRRRLAEALLRPPARLEAPSTAAGTRLARATLERRVRTSELVHAVAAVAAGRLGPAERRRVAIAVGAGRLSGAADAAGEAIADRSALLRLTDVAALDRAQIADALRTAPLEPPAWTGRRGRRLAAATLGVLSRRLGSTALVSHLGELAPPDGAAEEPREIWFAPVTGSGGLALGAVGLRGRTHLVLRAEGGWSTAALDALLEEVVGRLDASDDG
ncbi:hypothetical protein K8Z61_04235 [Nocardioides sp. TRM66260-LWL]|uniref:hypothetical protein n=1 Tax=Nocardioides sp. TRM66260-LWL TaxID=2874478 RepID=UPI001CC4754B|nr:hypothetical protein [Nocardioides sp. TRM66260-LWL]MBZ5733696.1 hypothetical protein [Nocardioides sp. TRM66260-LWL]